MRTYGDLKKDVLKNAGVTSHFHLHDKGAAYSNLWEEINHEEYRRGYDPVEYHKPGSKALCEMELLEQHEYDAWLARLAAIK